MNVNIQMSKNITPHISCAQVFFKIMKVYFQDRMQSGKLPQ